MHYVVRTRSGQHEVFAGCSADAEDTVASTTREDVISVERVPLINEMVSLGTADAKRRRIFEGWVGLDNIEDELGDAG